MKKVRLRNAEYNAGLPPYRFAPGDVIEIEDAWADQLVQRGIASKAGANTETVQERRAAMRDEQTVQNWEASAGDRAAWRAAWRAALEDELASLERNDAAPPVAAGVYNAPAIGRGDADGDAETAGGKAVGDQAPTEAGDRKPAAAKR